MISLIADLRYTLRRLSASPGFAAAALATMALGIGANSVMFTVVNAVMLRPMAVADPNRLVEIYTTTTDGTPATSSYPDYLDYRDQPVFTGGAALYRATLLNLTERGESTLIFAEAASGNYFGVLGLAPTLGRVFVADDDRAGAPLVAVLGHGFWQRRFGADPAVLGRTVVLNGRPVAIVGVGPREYGGGLRALSVDLWVPVHADFELVGGRGGAAEGRGNRSNFMRARLADGATIDQARAVLDVVSRRLEAAYPETNEKRRAVLYPADDIRFHPEIDRVLAPVAALLMAVPALVLLVACANIANLLLARASGRRREIAIRLAIGASRFRLVQQLMTESVVLGVAGGALGLLLARLLMSLVDGWRPAGVPIPLVLDLTMDARVVMFTVTVSLITGVVFGLAPALQATRPALVPALKDQSPAGLRAHRRFGLRNALVVTQVAVSLVLLTVAGLFVRSLQHAQDIDPGFERERAIVFMPVLSLTRSSVDERRRFTETLRERLRTLPGVDSVVLADRVPLGASVQTSDILVEGQQPNADGASFETDVTRIGPEYFAAMRIPLVSGRDFTEADGLAVDQVIVVSEAFAAKAWPGQSALGRRVTFPARPGRPASAPHTVVGVARDTKVRTLGEAPRPYLYRHWRQTGEDVGFVVRTHGDPQPLVASVRREALALEPDLPVIELKTMREHLSLMLTPPKLAASLLAACGVLAILLANLGLYAVVAYSVARRTREIGVRIALGAHRSDVLWLVIREGMALVLVGVVVGFALTAAIARPLGSYLYGLGSLDPLTFTVVATILAATALVANFVPARRAVRVDPLQAIRCE